MAQRAQHVNTARTGSCVGDACARPPAALLLPPLLPPWLCALAAMWGGSGPGWGLLERLLQAPTDCFSKAALLAEALEARRKYEDMARQQARGGVLWLHNSRAGASAGGAQRRAGGGGRPDRQPFGDGGATLCRTLRGSPLQSPTPPGRLLQH